MQKPSKNLTALAFSLLCSVALAAPQVVEQKGDLYLKEGSQLVRLTHYGYNRNPEVSPDGQWVAYLSEPEWSAASSGDPNDSGVTLRQPLPAQNVWLMNLKTKQAKRIAGQSEEQRGYYTIYRAGLA